MSGSFSERFQEKVLPKVMKFVNSKPVSALKNGMVATMPLTIVGSILLILAEFPIPAVKDFFINIGLTPIMMQGFRASFNFLAFVAVFAIAYQYAKSEDLEPLSAGIIAEVVFLINVSHNVTSETGEIIGESLSMEYFGAKGMVTAIIIGLLVGKFYSKLIKRGLVIKMPESVPSGVANSFNALIPAAIIILVSTAIYGIVHTLTGKTVIDVIYEVIQAPLQGVTDSLFGVILVEFIVVLLWWFGVHGASIVGGVVQGLYLANMGVNQSIIDAGKELTIANGGKIVTPQFADVLIRMTGSGLTIGIVVALLLRCKSKQFKELGKLALGPAIFNINEPVLFGLPVVLNPFMFIPLMLVPIITTTLSYFAFKIGFLPLYTAVAPPWTTPPIISGFLTGGWRMALMQVINIAISVAIYTPFVVKMDKESLKLEQELDN